MWGVVFQIVLYLLEIGIMLLLFSIKLTWKLLKYEFFWIKWSFKKYPFAFFSFFLHFIGYWLAVGMVEGGMGTWLLKIYTFGLASSSYGALELSIWPFKTFFELFMKIPADSWVFGVAMIAFAIAMIMLWLVVVIVFFESVFLLFPLLHAILTQLVLGLIFRPGLLKWRQRRTDKFYEKARKRAQADPEVQAAFRGLRQQMDNIQQSIADQDHANHTGNYQQPYSSATGMEQELRQMGLEPKERLRADGTGTGIMEVELPSYGPAKKAVRDFNETYNRAYEKVTDMSMYCYQAIDFLREQYGENSKAERMYADMLEKHYDLVDCFAETFDLVVYSEDATEIPKAYEEFKRNIMMVKNAQEEFVKTLEELYGKTLIQAIFKKLKED